MGEKLKPCPFCGNEHPEIASGDSVICNGIGRETCWASNLFEAWNCRVPMAWSSDPPTVPGDYLYAYRWAPGEPWVQHRMRVTEVPVDIDTSETLWLGPIPELPAKGGGVG